jgi:predicted HicB family RNase H-like nuclease
MLEYQGYQGVVEFDYDADIFFGEVVGLRDVITFEGKSVEELEQSFRDSVDEYLKFCLELGKSPEKPFSGKFNLRLPPELHRAIAVKAKKENKSLNQWASETLARAVDQAH